MEKKELTNWQAVGTGTFIGWFTLLFILQIVRYPVPLDSFAGMISIIGIPFGIAGAMAGKSWGENWFSIFIGSAIVTILGVGCLFFVLLYSGFLAQ